MNEDRIRIFGDHDEKTIAQLERCVRAEEGARGVLCADGHLGYSQPVGGVVAYREHVSVSGVGYDIACGNLAVRTDVPLDRKSTRLNSSHANISYAVFCLKKNKSAPTSW